MNALFRAVVRVGFASSVVLFAACHRPPATPSGRTEDPVPATPADATTEAGQIFATRCTPCHGANGAGDGIAAAALNPHPRNFHDATWQASVTDEQIQQIIRLGGAAVGKSPLMPANPDLIGRDAVVVALAAHLRSFR